MKICFLHHTYPGIGGTETVTNLLGCRFKEQGHEVFVLSWHRPQNVQLQSPLITLYLPDIRDIDSNKNTNFIRNFLINNDIDALINQGPFWTPTPEFKKLSCAIISVLHYAPDFQIANQRNEIERNFRLKSPTLSHLIKSTIRFSLRDEFAKKDFRKIFRPQLHAKIVNSDQFILICKEYIPQLKQLMQYDYDNLQSIPNGIALDADPLEKEKTVLYIGRLTRWDKRPDRLLKIWSNIEKEVSDWNLKILGDGPERGTLEELSKKLGLSRCEFCGFVETKPYLQKSAILAMTSTSEGFGMVILEAWKYGIIPLAYNVSKGIESLIDDGKTGFLIKPFDNNRYIKNMLRLMANKEMRKEMGLQCMEAVRAFNIDTIANQWLDLIKKIQNHKK